MKRPQIIGLTGPKGVGKTTVAGILQNHAHFASIAFGDLLRAEVCAAFSAGMVLFTDRSEKDTPRASLALVNNTSLEFTGAMVKHYRDAGHNASDIETEFDINRTPRELLKLWAEVYRKPHTGPHYFSRTLVSRVHTDHAHHQLRHVIHDVRFPIEAAAVRAMGGKIWQITRPGCSVDHTDPTETSGNEYAPDVIVENTHDLSHLQAMVMANWMRMETSLGWKDLANIGVLAIARV